MTTQREKIEAHEKRITKSESRLDDIDDRHKKEDERKEWYFKKALIAVGGAVAVVIAAAFKKIGIFQW